jgi:hypothetical protein
MVLGDIAETLVCDVDANVQRDCPRGVHVCGVAHVQLRGVISGEIRVGRGCSTVIVGRAVQASLHNDGVVYVSGAATFEHMSGHGVVVVLPGARWQGQVVVATRRWRCSDGSEAH